MIMKFEPWIGQHYGAPENFLKGKRVLILGESHHSSSDPVGSCQPNLTREVMTYYATGQQRGGWCRTLDNVAWAVSGKTPSELAQPKRRGEMAVWDAMAFYNYIPVILAEGSRGDRPSSDLWLKAKDPFGEVLKQLAPEVIVVCGYQMFPWVIRNNFPSYAEHPWDFHGDRLDFEDGQIRVVRMVHPSTAFSHRKWHSVLKAALSDG